MAFDLRLLDGDISFDAQGNLETVTNTDKLTQEIVKLLHTPKGTNPFDPAYGTSLTEDQIGTIPDKRIIAAKVEEEINSNLQRLITEQTKLRTMQPLTKAELLAEVSNVEVSRDKFEPRQWNIIVTVLAYDLTPLTFEFVINSR